MIAARNKIVSDPNVLLGKPVVEGTRISVEHILDSLAAGESVDDLMAAHPRLTREGISAALQYASESLRTERAHGIGIAAA